MGECAMEKQAVRSTGQKGAVVGLGHLWGKDLQRGLGLLWLLLKSYCLKLSIPKQQNHSLFPTGCVCVHARVVFVPRLEQAE